MRVGGEVCGNNNKKRFSGCVFFFFIIVCRLLILRAGLNLSGTVMTRSGSIDKKRKSGQRERLVFGFRMESRSPETAWHGDKIGRRLAKTKEGVWVSLFEELIGVECIIPVFLACWPGPRLDWSKILALGGTACSPNVSGRA